MWFRRVSQIFLMPYLSGQPKRRSYKAAFKLSDIEEVECGRHPVGVAEKFGISRPNVIKWIRGKPKFAKAAKSEYKSNLKIRKVKKYNQLYRNLHQKFQDCRAQGYRICFAWLWSNGQKIYRELAGDPTATIGHHVITTFIRRFA